MARHDETENLVKAENRLELSLINKSVKRLDDLSICQKLERVNLSKNFIEDANALKKCKRINWLNLANNKITTLGFLCSLKQLLVVNLGYNQIKEMEPIGALRNLKALILNNNKIERVAGLNTLTWINTLVLSNNAITEIDVSFLGSLKKLQLSHNQIQEFPNIKFNRELTSLSLNDNHIKQIPGECVCDTNRLELLDLGKNDFDKFKYIKSLTVLKGLKQMNLHGNSISEHEAYHQKILKLFPELKTLDSKPVDKIKKKLGLIGIEDVQIAPGVEDQMMTKAAHKRKADLSAEDGTDASETNIIKKKKLKTKDTECVCSETLSSIEKINKKSAIKDSQRDIIAEAPHRLHKPKTKEKKKHSKKTFSGVLEIKEIRKRDTCDKNTVEATFSSLESKLGTGMESSW